MRIAALREEAATYHDLLTRTERERERLMQDTCEMNELREKITLRYEQDKDQMRSTISRLKSEVADLNKELGEWRQTRMELDAIAEQMKEWENVKERYEERIRMLTLRLRDALGRKSPARGADRESDILEEGECPYLTKEDLEDLDRRLREENIAGRILHDLFSEEPDATVSGKSHEKPAAPGARRLPKDDTDWLIPLPPE